MIHAQCSLNPIGPGDVIVLALPDHPWGRLDTQHLMVVEWDDPAMEQRLISMQTRDNPNPVIVYPYAVFENGIVAIRSTERVNLDAMAKKQIILDRNVDKSILSTTDYSVLVIAPEAPAEEQSIIGKVVSAVTYPFVAAYNWLVG